MTINQGDVYWVQIADPGGAASDIPHPHVVIQDDVLNHSRIDTVVVCELTSNLKRVNMPGNVLLDAGEANLPRQSLVAVSKVSTVTKAQLGDYIGLLSPQRVAQIWAGMRFLQASFYRK
jgi:mRNA interferase MazF